ncbi:MAG: hypothetical protein JNL58_05840 [Planctomyces sp.]|nr:hypothetical protein [Planctomyces sp.]
MSSTIAGCMHRADLSFIDNIQRSEVVNHRLSAWYRALLCIAFVLTDDGSLQAGVEVTAEYSSGRTHFQFEGIPLPAVNDAGATGKWTILAGRVDANSGGLDSLSDGRVPTSEDQPSENFFFAAGTEGGMLALDLGEPREISEIVTYSWHSDSRAPQVYSIYGAAGSDEGFALPSSKEMVNTSTGWMKLADVDTRQPDRVGGQQAARTADATAPLGTFQHLLFVVSATDKGNRFSHTFFSEIDIVVGNGDELQRISKPELREIRFSTPDESYHFTIDVTQALELEQWSDAELKPVIIEWYPRIVSMLQSEGFEAAHDVRFQYLRDAEMKGIPAYASGNTISMNAEWFRGQLDGEARGAVVHEMVHVVQKYPGRSRRARGMNAPPGWIVEGIPDYIRWFLYEPETGGAKMSAERLKIAKHDSSYRTSANFIDWVNRNHPLDGKFLERLNAAARQGKYSAETWKELTGRTEQELADDWRSGR